MKQIKKIIIFGLIAYFPLILVSRPCRPKEPVDSAVVLISRFNLFFRGGCSKYLNIPMGFCYQRLFEQPSLEGPRLQDRLGFFILELHRFARQYIGLNKEKREFLREEVRTFLYLPLVKKLIEDAFPENPRFLGETLAFAIHVGILDYSFLLRSDEIAGMDYEEASQEEVLIEEGFVETVGAMCQICHERRPFMVSGCGRLYCENCFNNINVDFEGKCPFCREPFEEEGYTRIRY